jgi:hypothetical protein
MKTVNLNTNNFFAACFAYAWFYFATIKLREEEWS